MKSLKTWILLWILAVALCSYIRLYPLRAHIWEPTYDQASLYVVYNIKKALLEQIHTQAPQIPPAVAEQMATEKLNETLRLESPRIQQAIEITNDQMFKALNKKPNIYLLESDPFYFYYLTENIQKTGHIAQTIKGSKYFEPLMTAPSGFWQPMTYHPYVGFVVYKIAKFFDSGITLMSGVAYTPLVIMAFVLAAFFLACAALEVSAGAAFVSGLFFVMAPLILKRSSLGWYDTDPYNILFPLLILIALFQSLPRLDKGLPWKSALGLTLALTGFASIWQGWGFMLVITLLILGVWSIYSWLILKKPAAARSHILLGMLGLVGTLVGISLLFGFKEFFGLLSEGGKELQKFTIKGLSVWPNLFMEVGELNKTTMGDIITDCGGYVFLIACSLSFLYAVWLIFRNPKAPSIYKIVGLSVYLLTCMGLTIFAERFNIFTLLGLALFLSMGLEVILRKLSSLRFTWLAPAAVVLLSIFIFWNAQQNIKITLTPIYNSAWDKALIDIKEKTPPDSIVNTWWPPGHFIKAIAHRRVMFDGASLGESATGYWMANVLLSSNEAQAAGLLRMINLSGNQAVSFLTSKGLKTSQAVALLTTIAGQRTDEARPLLKALLKKEEDIQTLLTLTRGGSPHSYMFLYNELVDKNIGLSFMGKWNIQKVEELNENPSLLKIVPARNSAAYIDFLWELAGGPSRYSPPFNLMHQDDQKMYFSGNLVIEKSTMSATMDSPTYGKGVSQSTVYLSGDKIIEKLNFNGNLKYSVVIYSQDGQIMARLMDRGLANSLIVKLFFFNAAGLKHFQLLSSSNDVTGRTLIKTFEVSYS